MAMKINPPTMLKKSYERYKQELLAWKLVSDVAKSKQGIVVALSLPEDHETQIREKVFDEMDLNELKKEDGLEKLLTFIDSKLGKDLTDCLEKFEEFENIQRDSEQSIVDYIAKFDQKYHRLVKLEMTLPPAILVFKLLRKANITKNERLLVLTGMDFSKKDELYEQEKKSLLKFKGEPTSNMSNVSGNVVSGGHAIKVEPCHGARKHLYQAMDMQIIRVFIVGEDNVVHGEDNTEDIVD